MKPDTSGEQQDEECGSVPGRRTQRGTRVAGANGEMEGFIAIAWVVRPQGRKGEVLAEILTDFPARFAGLQRAYLDAPGNRPETVVVENTWFHKGKVVLKFAGIDSIGDAETLRGRYVLIPQEEKAVLGPHQYYQWELTGCQVVVESGGERKPFGTVTGIERTGGVDLLHVSDDSRDVLIPLAQEICKVIDPEAKVIVIDPPDELLDLNRE